MSVAHLISRIRPVVSLGRCAFGLLLVLALVRATPCRSQQLTRTIRLTEENDYFDFLVPLWRRPDNNYTQGLRFGWDFASVPSFARPLLCRERRACAWSLEFGQEMYTPSIDGARPIPGQRPYAGWLYGRVRAIEATARTRRILGVTLGVTGDASLAAQTQIAFHRLIGRSHRPLGWSQQLPTEADFSVEGEEAWYLGAPGWAARWLDIAPEMHAMVGTLRTALGLGGRARVGFPLGHPWLVDAGTRPWELYLFVGGEIEAVARDLFLDGDTFQPSVHVTREPLVANWERGIGVRLWRLVAEYRLVTQGRAYRGGPVAHSFGGITVGWRLTP